MKFEEPKALGMSRQDIEHVAGIVAKAVKYTPGKNLDKIVTTLGGEIKFQDWGQWMAPGTGSIETYGNKSFAIFLPDFTSVYHDRFTIAHEIGHYVLHSNLGSKRIKVHRLSESSQKAVEREANQFAAAFLMPKEAFEKVWNKFNSIESLANHFQVSQTAAYTRLKVLELA